MKQSLSWWCFEGRIGLDDLLIAAKRIGLAGIELIDPELWGVVQRHGLEIASHRGHTSIESGLNQYANHNRIEREFVESIQLAERWHIPNLIAFAGTRDTNLSEETAAQITAEGLARVAPIAEGAGVNVVLELLNSKVDHIGYQANNTAWGLKVCQMVGSPRVRLLYDVYHMQIMEGDIIRTITAHHDWIAHYHTAGNPGRNDLDDAQELYYPAIARAIHRTGYTGFIGHEFLPKGDPVKALEAAFKSCLIG